MLCPPAPLVPHLKCAYVDVRDVARAHVKAMTLPEAAGKRFILSTKTMWMSEAAAILKAQFGKYGYKPATMTAPNFVIWLAGVLDPAARNIRPELGYDFDFDNTAMRTILGIDPLPVEQTLEEMGHSLIQRGFIQKKPLYTPPQ